MTTTTETFLCRVGRECCSVVNERLGTVTTKKFGKQFLLYHDLTEGDEFRLEQVVTVTKIKPASAVAKAG